MVPPTAYKSSLPWPAPDRAQCTPGLHSYTDTVCCTDSAPVSKKRSSAPQDLAAYKKYREKEVSSAARGLIGLFREVAPQLLEKKDRGRGANLEAQPLQYGAAQIQVCVVATCQWVPRNGFATRLGSAAACHCKLGRP